MPLIKKIEKNNYQIGIWEMSESLEHLYLLNNKLDISKFKNINRKTTYNNITNNPVQFGLMSTDEMMILFGYFYYD